MLCYKKYNLYFQGQCTAGSLPVTRVKEGPGPPPSLQYQCPQACRSAKEQQQQQQKISAHNNNNNIRSTNKNNKNNIMEITGNKKQECLSYLGEANEFSPEKLCKSHGDIKKFESLKIENLKSYRLKHCCERDVLSSLTNENYNLVINDGKRKFSEADCIRVLKDLIETDQLASRITCELTEILVRYDCKQPYSLIHQCEDCRVSALFVIININYNNKNGEKTIQSNPIKEKGKIEKICI